MRERLAARVFFIFFSFFVINLKVFCNFIVHEDQVHCTPEEMEKVDDCCSRIWQYAVIGGLGAPGLVSFLGYRRLCKYHISLKKGLIDERQMAQ